MKSTCNAILLTLAFILVFTIEARATFPSKAIALWPDEQSDQKYSRVFDLTGEKQWAKAMEVVENIILESPKKTSPLILKAMLLNEQGEYLKALETLGKAQGLNARRAGYHFGFCQIYRNLGVGKLSVRGCQVAVGMHPESPEVNYEYALTLAALGNMEKANQELTTAAQLDPNNSAYPYEMGMNFYYLNQYDEAERSFLKALKTDPDNLDAAYQLAYLYAARNKPDQARTYIFRLLETRRDHPKVRSAKILLDYVEKNSQDRLPLKIVPHEYHVSRSKSLYQSGKYGLALLEIQTAARLKPEDLKIQEILIGLSSIMMRLQITEEAIDHVLARAGDNSILKAKAYQERGDIRIMQGNLGEARAFYEKAMNLQDPDNLARISIKEMPEGLTASKPRFDPDKIFFKPTEALNRKGEIFASYGMYKRAIAIYSIVLQMDMNHLPSMLNTATAYYNSGQNNRAISILERLLITHPNHEHILAHRVLLAKAYVKNGDRAEGLKSLEMAVKLNPDVKRAIKMDPDFEELKDTPAFKKITE